MFAVMEAVKTLRVIEVEEARAYLFVGLTSLSVVSKFENLKVVRVSEIEEPRKGRAWLIDDENGLLIMRK